MSQNQEEKLEILKKNNPFISSSVGDPWKSRQYPDVKSVNKDTFKGICRLMDQKSKNPGLECACLVLGEVGSGKTHLIGRILQYSEQTDSSCSFAYIQPIENPEQTYRYLVREVIINLCRPMDSPAGLNQLEKIIVELFREVLEKAPSSTSRRDKVFTKAKKKMSKKETFQQRVKDLARNLFKNKNPILKNFGKAFVIVSDQGKVTTDIETKTDQADLMQRLKNDPALIFKPEFAHYTAGLEKQIKDIILTSYPEIYENFLNVLLQYRLSSKRRMAQSWLKGNLIGNNDAKMLSVDSRDEASTASVEYEAREILNSFGIILGRYNLPLVICFDRLENLETDDQIYSLGKMVEFLNDRVKTMLPIVFVRGQGWMENFSHRLNQHVISRLETNKFELEDCTAEQAVELIKKRLSLAYGKTGSPDINNDLYPFTREELLKKFKPGRFYTPRTIISLANEQLTYILLDKLPERENSLDKLRYEFSSQLMAVKNDFDRYQPDHGRLRRALEIYLNQLAVHNETEMKLFMQPPKYGLKSFDMCCRLMVSGAGMVDAGFIFDVEQNSNSVRTSLKRGLEFLKLSSSGKIFYIRDGRSLIPSPPKWQATNDLLENFINLGGNVLILDKKQAELWYALALFSYAVKEGDITIIKEKNHQMPVSFDQFFRFVKKDIHRKTDSGFSYIFNKMIKNK